MTDTINGSANTRGRQSSAAPRVVGKGGGGRGVVYIVELIDNVLSNAAAAACNSVRANTSAE